MTYRIVRVMFPANLITSGGQATLSNILRVLGLDIFRSTPT